MAKFAMAGQYAGLWLHPESLAGGAVLALIACAGAILWYAPLVAYLMLVSAWAPRAPFLWAVLPPIAAAVLETVVLQTSHVRNFVFQRLLGMYETLGSRPDGPGEGDKGLAAFAERLGKMDWHGRVDNYFTTPELWLGLVAAGLLLAAAMWVRRYRDETS
jgi:ABC-2 type transport system permease protein